MTGNGRAITLDPILDREPLLIQPVRVESSVPAGFRMEWLSGEGDDVEFDLSSGAGLGNVYLILSVKNKTTGHVIEEVVDMRDVVKDWIVAAVDAGPSPVWNWEKGAFE